MSKEKERILRTKTSKHTLPPRITLPSATSKPPDPLNPFLQDLPDSRNKKQQDFAVPETTQKHYWTKEEVVLFFLPRIIN